METRRHIKILAWLYLLLPTLGVGFGSLLLLLFEPGLDPTLDALGDVLSRFTYMTAFLMAAIVYVLLNLTASLALFRRTWWARNFVLVVGLINLLNVPVGTFLGVYTIRVLGNDEIRSTPAA